MSASTTWAGSLEPLARVCEGLAALAVSGVLGSAPAVRETFRVTDAPPDADLLYCLIPNSNSRFHVQLAVGLAKDDLPHLFPSEIDEGRRLQALCGMSGTVARKLVSDPGFIGRFGALQVSSPFYSEGAFSDRRDAGIRGALDFWGRRLGVHITVRRASLETWHGETLAEPG